MQIVKLNKINIKDTISNAKQLLEKDSSISPALKAMVEMLLMIITLLAARFGLNSTNSSTPPSRDLNRKKKKNTNGNKKPGGQPGHLGKTLEPISNPDTIISIQLDKRRLPKGRYREIGFESRQVIDIEISRIVTEYRAQILEDETGKQYVAEFPENMTKPIQYGQSIKAHAVYLSQFQLIPYERVADYFINKASIPISVGSLFNFNQEAYERLASFDALAKQRLINGPILHADETSINVNGKRIWLHNASNELWTYFYPHEKRGTEAMNDIGILPNFHGVLIHDHWKPYFTYLVDHALCNAHHIRELQWVIENDESATWAKDMQDLLIEINEAVNKAERHCLNAQVEKVYRLQYRRIIQKGELEMPLIRYEADKIKKRGREKKTKGRNLLERLRDFENDVLRFMIVGDVPFTNNRGENDIRMTKVQQKISGCFKSIDGAKIFCRVRSYLLTAQKHGVTPSDALKDLFNGKLPEVFLR